AAQEALNEAIRLADPTFKLPELDPNAVRAQQDYSLILDGGEGDDWVISVWGESPLAPDVQATANYLAMLKASREEVSADSPHRLAELDALIAVVEDKLERERSGIEFHGVNTIGGLG